MSMNNLTEYIKKAFDYKTDGHYKEAIDYFYKALAIDNESCEIMTELAYLYSKLNQYDRAVNFYEQVLMKHPDDYQTRFFFAMLYKKLREYDKAIMHFVMLLNAGYEVVKISEELFPILAKKNNYEKIIELYNLRANSLKSSIIYYYLGLAYLEQGKGNIAEDFFEKSYKTDENNIDAGCTIAEKLLETGDICEAESVLNKLLKHSENDKLFYLLAEVSYLKADYDMSIKYYSMAIRLNENNAQYYYKLGTVYALKGFLQEAEECYCRSITIEPENLLYNYTLAYLYFMNNKQDLSKRIADYVLSINPEFLSGLSLSLLLLLKSNDISQINKVVEKIETAKQKDDFAYYALASYYAKLSMWGKAVEHIEKAISFNENSCDYNYELAGYYFEMKDYDKSEAICKKILSNNVKFINAYILLARILVIKQNFAEANQNIEKAMNLDINIPEIYYLKGQIAENQGMFESAIENYKTALLMSPSNIKYYSLVAGIYYSQGKFEDAYRYYKEASLLDITNSEYRYLMAKCSEEEGNIEEAKVNYSFVRRLSPQNAFYVEEYAKFLIENNNKKGAESILKNGIKTVCQEDKIRLKNILKEIK